MNLSFESNSLWYHTKAVDELAKIDQEPLLGDSNISCQAKAHSLSHKQLHTNFPWKFMQPSANTWQISHVSYICSSIDFQMQSILHTMHKIHPMDAYHNLIF
jgi:hypothetical protein